MQDSNTKQKFKIIATRCDKCDPCCPTVLESDDGENIVIVGEWDKEVLNNETVTAKIGESETAVVIPKSLLLEAMKSLK